MMENTERVPLKIFFQDIKFEHSIFALPFAYLGLFLAEGGRPPRLWIFLGVTAAMVSFRTFAMALNRLVDREVDAENPRTWSRALPSRRLSSGTVAAAAFFSLLIFLGSSWLLGRLCFMLSPVPIFLAVAYPYLKRFTWLSHAVLGIILGISPYGAWLASRSEFSWVPGWLMIGIACWVAGFDILYSLQDFGFDREFGLKSVPVRFGEKRARSIAAFLHGVAVVSWAMAGSLAGLGWIYAVGIGLVAVFLFREHWLVYRFGLGKINQAFFTVNAGISVAVFIAAFIDLNLR